ncbi:MAG: anthranilate phosphoribosyltransferase [Candidatus Micrarchaeota archaeon]|nr:anthranilate phosphoribosyltransferase [Candidatus Micrarchaeota archaeon]
MDFLKKVIEGQDLSQQEARLAMGTMMQGTLTHAQAAGLLIALKMKGETAEEISAFALAMREHGMKIKPLAQPLVDTCGTGGDSSFTFNVSTAAGIIASACGVKIAKHGNRSVSGKCGSADVLEALGVKMLAPSEVEKCIDAIGFGFMFAPLFHPAMKNVMPVRKELGVRTVFNILGPLSNPAGAKRQVLGVYEPALVPKMAEVLLQLGSKHALVVHSEGIDEIGLGNTQVCEVLDGKIREFEMRGSDFGLSLRELPKVHSPQEGATVLLDVLGGKEGAALDVSLLNAAAAVYVSGKAPSIKEGLEMARHAVSSGAALGKLRQLQKFGE